MTEELAARLFKMASSLGWKYEIELPGDESIVAMSGPTGELDFRVSDSEHVIHELAHCILFELDLEPADTLMKRLGEHTQSIDENDAQLNEIETFSVVMEVLRRLGLKLHEDDFTAALEIQTHGFEPPTEYVRLPSRTSGKWTNVKWTLHHMRHFHETKRGRRAAQQLIDMLKENE